MFRFLSTLVLLLLVAVPGEALAQATGTITGTVTDEEGQTLIGASVRLEGTTLGAATNVDGEYRITGVPVGEYDVTASYTGYQPVTETGVAVSAGAPSVVDFTLLADAALDEVVVTALGIERSERALSYSSQEVDAEDLGVSQDINLKTALAGKVAGLQMVGQAGAKLGSFGAVRIRGAISLTSDLAEPLYVVDGVPVSDPNLVDMNNVAEISVLKGPNATALYGQRGENGVVLLTTKTGANQRGWRIELFNSTTAENVAYLPEYQNEYGQGTGGEAEFVTFNFDPEVHPDYFEPLDGSRILSRYYQDQSWGPRFDGESYAAWYNFFPDSPYYGQTATWEAQPDNIANFYETGLASNSGVAVSYAEDRYSARVSYTNLGQSGLLPNSSLNKHFMGGRFQYDVTERFDVSAKVNYTMQDVAGDVYSDGYGNQTSGAFNSWFARQVEMDKLRELKDLTTPAGYSTSWNWWGPNSYAQGGGYEKPTFFYNPYTWMDRYNIDRGSDQLLLNAQAGYDFTDNWSVRGTASHARNLYQRRFELPYFLEYSSAPELYNEWANSFGELRQDFSEFNYDGIVNFQDDFGDWSLDALGGGTIRNETFENFSADMSQTNTTSGGLIIPDVYQFSNSAERIVPNEYNWDKRVYSLYTRATLGWDETLYLEGSYRQDWSSALPEDNNGYGYPSIGASLVFSEMIPDYDWLSFGKVRASWAQVGDDVGAEDILQSYALSNNPYINPISGGSTPLLFTDNVVVDPNIQPALNTSFETGVDLRFLDDLFGLNATYYNETREDEIIAISTSSAFGATGFLTNAGSAQRQGVELSLNVSPVRSANFRWDATANWALNETVVTDLPQDLETYEIGVGSAFDFVSITHRLDEEWGQLRGAGIARNEAGLPIINENGLFVVEQNQYFGSILPDWTGGFLNTFAYKSVSLTASLDFQRGGNFFSLSEMWGTYTGQYEDTAGLNDRGVLQRNPVDEGGGVHVVGVSPTGEPVDMYVPAQRYYQQWYANRLAEPFIHDASYLKLRELNLSYTVPQRWLGGYAQAATIGVVGRNLWLIAVSGDNVHGWDPSEFAETFGENGQLPGTRSFGINLNVTL